MRRRNVRIVLATLLLMLVVPTMSYVQALTYPGHASFAVRSVEWLREHGGNGLVNAVETWKYQHDTPPVSGPPTDMTVADTVAAPPSPRRSVPRLARRLSGPAPVGPLPGLPPIPGEGVWHSVSTVVSATPHLYTTWFRPDGQHAPVSVGAALFPRSVTRFGLVGGTREPVVGLSSPSGHAVPLRARARLVATFNAGFKTRDAMGGWFADGRAAVPLHQGAASLVIDDQGRVSVGDWGREVKLSRHTVAVRQNLSMIVRHGVPVNGLDRNANGRFGSVKSQFQYTWRSGVGTTSAGDVVYVAGNRLTLQTLARAMSRAGIQEGLELDIHPHMVTFNVEHHTPSGLRPAHLLPSMNEPPSRYLSSDQRDFFYVTAS